MTVAPMQVPIAQLSDAPDWTLLRNLGLAFVVILWLATAFWTFKDARRRIADPWLVALATVLGFVLPFVGPVIYMFFRPPEYLRRRARAPSRDQGDGAATRARSTAGARCAARASSRTTSSAPSARRV